MMFPLSLIVEAKRWLDELNEGTIEMWDELRTAFISRFFPPALFDRLLREICAFSQHENESLTDAWLCMKEMITNCHGHNLSKGNIIKIFYHGRNEITQEVLNATAGGIFLYKTPNQAYQLLEVKDLLKLDWAKNQKTKSSLKKSVAFADEGNSNSDTDKIMARMHDMTIKMDAEYKELQSRAKQPIPDLDDDDIPMSREEEAKFMQTFLAKNHQASIQNLETKFDRLTDKQCGRPSGSLPSNTQPNPRGGKSKAYQPPQSRNKHVNAIFTRSADLGASINLMLYSLYAKLSLESLKPTKMSVRLADRSFQYPVEIAENMLVEVGKFTFPADFVILEMEEDRKVPLILDDRFFTLLMHINVIDEILEEDFNALLDEGSKILHSIEGTLLEEEIFSEFNKFIAMTADEIYDSETDTEEPPFEKITINTDYKIKTSLEEPPTDLKLKPLHDNLEYVFLEEPSFLPVIISSKLFV
ncbi:reverse transcriptase domain-containing protein [Tanacetum coccineum]